MIQRDPVSSLRTFVRPKFRRLSPIIFSKIFMVLFSTSKSTNYFVLIFVWDVVFWSRLIFCLWMSYCSSIICWKGHLSSVKLLLHLSQQLGVFVSVYFQVLYCVPLNYVSIPPTRRDGCVIHRLDNCSCTVSLELE